MSPEELSRIAEVMKEQGLTRVRLEDPDGGAVELERGTSAAAAPATMPVPVAMPLSPMAASGAPVAPGAPAAPAAAPEPPEDDAEDEDADAPLDLSKAVAVRAPMVGVFYAAPAPGAEPFVHVGSKVRKGETLCVIEAMKVMNEVTAETDGEVIDICVNDGDLVEYGCCLMKISEE